MTSRKVLHKIEHFADDVGARARCYASLGKVKMVHAFRSGKDIVREKTDDISSTISKTKKKILH